MKNLLPIAGFLLFNALHAQHISSTFDTNIDNWLVVGDATSANPNFIAEGGNPGGYASADDTAAGGVWFWSAPAKFLGNQSGSFGKQLSFDLKQSSLDSQFDDSDVIITSPELAIAFNLAANPGTDWTHYSTPLDAGAAWQIDNILNPMLATNEQILLVLSNISSLKIRGEYVSGFDTGGLDNVILETIPLSADSFSVSRLGCYLDLKTNIIYFSKTVSAAAVYDMQGKQIPVKMQQNAIDISHFPKGIYIVEMQSETKKQSVKILKQ